MEVAKSQLLPSQLVIGATSAVSTTFARGFAWIATGTTRGVYVHRGSVVGAKQYVHPGLSTRETHNASHSAQPTLADNSFTLWQHITLPKSPLLPPAAANSLTRANHDTATSVGSSIKIRAVSWCQCGPRQLWLAFTLKDCVHIYAPSSPDNSIQITWNRIYSFRLCHCGDPGSQSNNIFAKHNSSCSIAWCPSGRQMLVNSGSCFMCDVSSVRRQYSHIGPKGVVSWSFSSNDGDINDAKFSYDNGSLFYTFAERSRYLRVWYRQIDARDQMIEENGRGGTYAYVLLGLRSAIVSVAWHPGGCLGGGSSDICSSSFRNSRVLLVLTMDGRASLFQEEKGKREMAPFYLVARVGLHNGSPAGFIRSVDWIQFEHICHGAQWDAKNATYNDDECDDFDLLPAPRRGMSSTSVSDYAHSASCRRNRSYIVSTIFNHRTGKEVLSIWYIEGLQVASQCAVKVGLLADHSLADPLQKNPGYLLSARCFFILPEEARSLHGHEESSKEPLNQYAKHGRSFTSLHLPEPDQVFAIWSGVDFGVQAQEDFSPSWGYIFLNHNATQDKHSYQPRHHSAINTCTLQQVGPFKIYERFHSSNIKGILVEGPTDKSEHLCETVCLTWSNSGYVSAWHCDRYPKALNCSAGWMNHDNKYSRVSGSKKRVLSVDSALGYGKLRWRVYCVYCDDVFSNADNLKGPELYFDIECYHHGKIIINSKVLLSEYLEKMRLVNPNIASCDVSKLPILCAVKLIPATECVFLAFMFQCKNEDNVSIAVWKMCPGTDGTTLSVNLRNKVIIESSGSHSPLIGYLKTSNFESNHGSPCLVVTSSVSFPKPTHAVNECKLRTLPLGDRSSINFHEKADSLCVVDCLPKTCVGVSSLAENDTHKRIAAVCTVHSKEIHTQVALSLCILSYDSESDKPSLNVEDFVKLQIPYVDLPSHKKLSSTCCWLFDSNRSEFSSIAVADSRHVFVYHRSIMSQFSLKNQWVCVASYDTGSVSGELPIQIAAVRSCQNLAADLVVACGSEIHLVSEMSAVHSSQNSLNASRTGVETCMLSAYHTTFLQSCLFQGNYSVINKVLQNLALRFGLLRQKSVLETSIKNFVCVTPEDILGKDKNTTAQSSNEPGEQNQLNKHALQLILESLGSINKSLKDENALHSKNLNLSLKDHFRLEAFVRALVEIFGKELPISKENMHNLGGAGLDDCGVRFYYALVLFDTACLDCLRKESSYMMSLAHISWAAHSMSTRQLVDICFSRVSPSWDRARSVGMGFWLQSQSLLIDVIERIAKYEFVKSGQDPYSCFLYYILLGKSSVLAGLFRMKRDMKMADFLSNDFAQSRWSTAAIKNASRLMQQRRYKLAAAFFILGQKPSEAVRICLKLLHDLQLSIFVAQLCGSRVDARRSRVSQEDYPSSLLKMTVEKAILPELNVSSQPILASLLYWIIGDQQESLHTLLQLGSECKSMLFASYDWCPDDMQLQPMNRPGSETQVQFGTEAHDGILFDHISLILAVAKSRRLRKSTVHEDSTIISKDTASSLHVERNQEGKSSTRETAASLFASRNRKYAPSRKDTAVNLFQHRDHEGKLQSRDTASELFSSRLLNSAPSNRDKATNLFLRNNGKVDSHQQDTATALFSSRNPKSSLLGNDKASSLFHQNNEPVKSHLQNTAAALFASRNATSKDFKDTAQILSQQEDNVSGLKPLSILEGGSIFSKTELVSLKFLKRRLSLALISNGLPTFVICNELFKEGGSVEKHNILKSLCNIYDSFLANIADYMQTAMRSYLVSASSFMYVPSDNSPNWKNVLQRTSELFIKMSEVIASNFRFVESYWGIETVSAIIAQLMGRFHSCSSGYLIDILLITLKESLHDSVDDDLTDHMKIGNLNFSKSASHIVEKAIDACTFVFNMMNDKLSTSLNDSTEKIIKCNTSMQVHSAFQAYSMITICDALNLWQLDSGTSSDMLFVKGIAHLSMCLICSRLAWHVQNYDTIYELIQFSPTKGQHSSVFLKCACILMGNHFASVSRLKISSIPESNEGHFSGWISKYIHNVLEKLFVGYCKTWIQEAWCSYGTSDCAVKYAKKLYLLKKSKFSFIRSWIQIVDSCTIGRTQPTWYFSRVHPERRAIPLDERINQVFVGVLAEANKMATSKTRISNLWQYLDGLTAIKQSRKVMMYQVKFMLKSSTKHRRETKTSGLNELGLLPKQSLSSHRDVLRLGEDKCVSDICLIATYGCQSQLALVGPSSFLEHNISAFMPSHQEPQTTYPMATESRDKDYELFSSLDLKFSELDLPLYGRNDVSMFSPRSGTKDLERPSTLASHGTLPVFLSGCSKTGRLYLWRFGRSRALHQYQTLSGSSGLAQPTQRKTSASGINKVRFSLGSERFGAVDESGTLSIWQFGTDPVCLRPYATILCDALSACDFAFIGNSSSVIATVGKHKKTSLCVWDTLLPVHSRLVASVPSLGALNGAFSSDIDNGGVTSLLSLPSSNGATLIGGGSDGSIKVFDTRMLSRDVMTGHLQDFSTQVGGPMHMQCVASPSDIVLKAQNENQITSMSYCMHSRRLATASRNGAVRVWDGIFGSRKDGLPRAPVRAEDVSHQGVMWTDRGKLLTWGDNGVVLIHT